MESLRLVDAPRSRALGVRLRRGCNDDASDLPAAGDRAGGVDAERRREEADLAAGTARVLLGGATLADALPEAARLIGEALGLSAVEIVLDPLAGATGQEGVALDPGSGRRAVLVLGTAADEATVARVSDRVAPALEAVLRAALDRDRLQIEVIETQALRRSDDIKTALLRAVSHDLRTPLTAIITAGHALRTPELDARERDELVLVVIDEARRLSALVDKLLDLSKLQAGAAEPRRDVLAGGGRAQRRRRRRRRGHVGLRAVLRSGSSARAGRRRSAGARLRQPAGERDAPQRGHPVKVRARVVGGKDEHPRHRPRPGMTATQMTRAFEPFYRDGDGHAGSGLGLAIVRGFVEANGGHVHAESLPGQGTVFAIALPLGEQATSRAPRGRGSCDDEIQDPAGPEGRAARCRLRGRRRADGEGGARCGRPSGSSCNCAPGWGCRAGGLEVLVDMFGEDGGRRWLW